MTQNRAGGRAEGKVTILIVDDHPLFRDGLQKALELEDDLLVLGQSDDGEKALQMARDLRPDVVLLDVSLPSMNGMQVARLLKSEQTNVNIVMLTGYHDSEQVLHAVRAGAAAYCAKDITPDKLVAVIRDVAAGMFVIEEVRMDARALESWIQSNIEAMTGPYMVDPNEHFVPLSPREMEILQFVTHGLSNKEIATKLGISQQTVKNHMTSILKKLNVEDRTQAAVTALRHGWVRIQDNDFGGSS
ncbi:MAG: response regulator transcription factor [Chloroflexi bacterium]|nr:response regulator transcription factor [Chloroflexota bacterium]